MSKYRCFIFLLMLCFISLSNAQRDYRDYVRGGNKFYTDSLFDKSEIEYRKALEQDANGVDALYNLGNSLLLQNKAKDAMDQYKIAEKRENDSSKLAQIHHNMGVIYQGSKEYAAAVEAYKQSLRENPNDHETRYNLALAMRQLKQQQDQQEQQQDKQEQQQDKQEQQQDKQEQQQDKQEQQQDKQEQQQDKREQQQDKQEQQEQQGQNREQQEISKENAEQILQAAMQDEKEIQEKVKKMLQLRGRKLEKDW